MPTASTFETQTIGGAGSAAAINRIQHLSSRSLQLQPSSMVNIFGESVGSGGSVDLQMAKKVVVTKGQYKDYVNEIQQSYELGFTPYRLHTSGYDTYVTPIRVYNGWIYVSDVVATMEATN